MRKSEHLAASLLTGVSVLALASLAAQAQPAAPAQVEEVVVTGSRVIANGNDMPTPVTVVAPQELTSTAPGSVMDALQELPVFAGGRSPQTNVGNSSQNNASHQFNIRNVGTTRTLVLYNGRRLAPTSYTGEIDADTIPQMLLQRVDVVTGGTSAVYGSDAVAGVVNFITDKGFNGVKGNAQYGVSEYGDSIEERVGIAGGTPVLDGKGHLEGSVEFYNNQGIDGHEKFNRTWETLTKSSQGGGTPTNPNRLISYTRLASTSYSGYIGTTGNSTANPLRDMEFAGPGNTLVPFVHGTASGTNLVESGGDGIYYQEASLVATTKQGQIFGRFDYDFSDDLSGYIEVTGSKIGNTNVHQTNEYRNVTLSATNAFLAPAYQSQLAASKITTFVFSKGMLQSPPLQSRSMTTSSIVQAGFNGTVFGKYKWDVSAVHNENDQYTHNPANPSTQKSFAAMDAVKDASGNIVCNVTLTNPGLYPGCVPLNMFGNGSETPAMLAYVLDDTHFKSITKLDDVGGSIAGSPFDLWAGPVQVALSGEWRETTLHLKSNAQASAHANCTGLRFNCNSGTALYISNVVSDQPGAEQSVWETALELSVPLLKDLPFVQSLDLDLAGRYAHYDTSGPASTWKVGLDWHLNDEITVRAVQSRDFRAPNLNDLFSPQLVNPAGTTDYHVLNAAGQPTQLQAPFITLSNPALKPEVGITDTAGVVYRPEWLENFSISVDYYHIKIANAITNLQGQNQTIQQICEASNGTSPYCSLALRPLPFSDHTTANLTTGFLSQPQNAQTLTTEGTDIEINYQTDLGPGHLTVRNLSSYQPMQKTLQFIGAPTLNAANAPGLPGFRSTLFVKYTWDAWTFNIQERMRGGSSLNSNRPPYVPAATATYYDPSFPIPGPALWTNINIAYDWDDAPVVPMTFSLAIENLFDRPPTLVGGGSTVPGLFPGQFTGDDTVGRYFTMGVKFKM
jgi:outer membrane receptor protein involved in Fe transport